MARARQSPVADPAQVATIAALPDAMLVTLSHWRQGGTRILFANEAFCRLTGYSARELVGKNTRLLHGAKTDLLILRHGRRLSPARQLPTGGGEAWLYRKDGTPFFARWIFSPLPMAAPTGLLVLSYHDQTEGESMRIELQQAQKLATLGLLASGVAHDFNNLITVINGYCEILRRKTAGMPKVQRDLDEIHLAGLKASAIARQILEYSRRQKAEIKVVNCNTLIREIAEILRRVAGDEVVVEFRLASDLGNVRIDPTQFQQVLLNLCGNARDAMPKGGALTIRTSNLKVSSTPDGRLPEMAPGHYVVVRVSDNGLGMAPDILHRIFERFFTTKVHGTGLGLATVQGIIRQYHGQIRAQSTPGEGSAFEILLPETLELEPAAPVPLPSLPVTAGTETLLIIEEDLVLRKMIAGILGHDGYRVVAEATPADATAAVAAGDLKPHLVLASGDQPAVAALVRRLRARNRALRFISISILPPAPGRTKVPAKAMMHLPKPFELSALVAAVRTLLDAARG